MTAAPQEPDLRSPGDPRITHGEAAGVTDTSTDSLVPPLASPLEGTPTADPGGEVDRLTQFLFDRFPGEMDRTNRQVAETPVDVAIRLLSALSGQGTSIERCDREYCNKPRGHQDLHGWVHYQ